MTDYLVAMLTFAGLYPLMTLRLFAAACGSVTALVTEEDGPSGVAPFEALA